MGKKLIEVALPLDIINDASVLDKRPEVKQHPKRFHLWWARLPLPSARAILFASLVDDPSAHPDQFPTEEDQVAERERLFEIIRKLCQKKIHTHQEVFEEAHKEILKHCDSNLPTLLDPFAGGGSIPLEGMRLGLPVLASDLNPVAVLINKAQLEILPQLANQVPVNPEIQAKIAFTQWKLGKGLAEDLRYYGKWINEEAKKHIGQFFPKVMMGNKEHNVITWLWARTVKCPNPACGCEMPLVRSFILSSKMKPNFYSRPIIEHSANGNKVLGYEVLQGFPEIKGTVNRSGATCVSCNEPVKLDYIRSEGRSSRIGQVLFAMVIEQQKGKVFVSPTNEQQTKALQVKAKWKPETKLPEKALGFRVQLYGMNEHWMLFSERQLLSLSTLHELAKEVSEQVIRDGGNKDYAKAIQFYLTLSLSRLADFNNSLTTWSASREEAKHVFTRQAIPMVWDFPESNPLGDAGVNFLNCISLQASTIECTLSNISKPAIVQQFNASKYDFSESQYLISTDPPYYDNIGYSDLSDFFYVWLRKNLTTQFPDLLRTVLVPKMEELVADDFRYGGKEEAKSHFEAGFKEAFQNFKKGLDLSSTLAFLEKENPPRIVVVKIVTKQILKPCLLSLMSSLV